MGAVRPSERAAEWYLPKLREYGDDVALGQLVRKTAGVNIGGVGKFGVPTGLAGNALREGNDAQASTLVRRGWGTGVMAPFRAQAH